jgi:hypothetical protein
MLENRNKYFIFEKGYSVQDLLTLTKNSRVTGFINTIITYRYAVCYMLFSIFCGIPRPRQIIMLHLIKTDFNEKIVFL